MELGEILRELRKSEKLSQSDLAKELKVDRSTYAKYETGDSSPDYEKLKKLAAFFGVSTDLLLGVHDNEVGEAITQERQEQGITIKEFSKKLGVRVADVLEYESSGLPENLRPKLIKIFGMTYSELLYKYDLYDEQIPSHFDGDVNAYESFKTARDNDALNEPPKNITLAAHRTDGYDTDLPEEAQEELNSYIEFLKMKYKKKD